MPRRGQGALEFLITYGWAILVIIVVFAILFYLGVFRPTGPVTCNLGPGLSCFTFVLENGTAKLTLDIGQAMGRSVVVTGLRCTQEPGTIAIEPLAHPVSIGTGEHAFVAGGDSGNALYCRDGNGSVASGGQVGEPYRGRLIVSYTRIDTGESHIVTGDISTKFEVPGPGMDGARVNGDSCAYSSQCLSNFCYNGMCAPAPDGTACTADEYCQNSNCVNGFCGGAPEGMPCGSHTDCFSSSCVNGMCEKCRPSCEGVICITTNKCELDAHGCARCVRRW